MDFDDISLLSVIFKNFWCRYLCPYGTLAGIAALISPVMIKRNEDACIECCKCSRKCPALLSVDRLKTVSSAGCTDCLRCVSHCPAKGALSMTIAGRYRIDSKAVAVIVQTVFFGIILADRITGHWQ